MESRSTWKPLQFAIQEIIEANEERSLLAYELVDQLKKKNFLSAKVDSDNLVEALDQGIWDHEDALNQGRCGNSLPMRLSRIIEKLG